VRAGLIGAQTHTHAQHTDSPTVQRGVYSFFSALCFPQSPAKIMCIRTVFARFLRFLRQKTARTKVATLNLHIFSHTNMHNFRAQVCAPCHVDYLVVFHFFLYFGTISQTKHAVPRFVCVILHWRRACSKLNSFFLLIFGLCCSLILHFSLATLLFESQN